MKALFDRFVRNESGATAIEYGLIAALVAVAIIGALGLLRDSVTQTYNRVANALNSS